MGSSRGVRLNFIRPGKPLENAYIESFNGCNTERPHSSLGNLAPAHFAALSNRQSGQEAVMR
jgi:transposase InsO family protein